MRDPRRSRSSGTTPPWLVPAWCWTYGRWPAGGSTSRTSECDARHRSVASHDEGKSDQDNGGCRNRATDNQVEQMMPAMRYGGYHHRSIDDHRWDQRPSRTAQRIGHDGCEDRVARGKG